MGNELEKKRINFFFLGGVQKEVFPFQVSFISAYLHLNFKAKTLLFFLVIAYN